MLTVILTFLLSSPLFILLVLQLKYPRDMILWGQRWKYNDDPDISDAALKYTRITSILGVIFFMAFFVLWFISEL